VSGLAWPFSCVFFCHGSCNSKNMLSVIETREEECDSICRREPRNMDGLDASNLPDNIMCHGHQVFSVRWQVHRALRATCRYHQQAPLLPDSLQTSDLSFSHLQDAFFPLCQGTTHTCGYVAERCRDNEDARCQSLRPSLVSGV